MAGVKVINKLLSRVMFILTALKPMSLGIAILLFVLSAAVEPVAALDGPDTKKVIAMARATWDTGWFQAEIVKKLLEELGYSVASPQTMNNREFYLAAARGEMDLWANGWFPSHTPFIEDEQVRGKVEAIGFEVIAGALQGFLVDKKTAEALHITNLGDLKNPRIAGVFDRNGNGKADLIGCNTGWGCERIVNHHLDAFDLRATVEHVQGDYSPLMAETVAR